MNSKISIFISVLLSLTVLLTGCSHKPKPINQKPVSLPSWFLDPPLSSGRYMYAAAIGEDKKDAINNALSSIISTLSIKIKSSYSSKIKEHNYYTDTKIINSVEAKTSPVNINNYILLKAVQIGYERIVVLVSVDKTKFVNGLISHLNYQKKNVDMRYDTLSKEGALKRYDTLAGLMKSVKQMQRTLGIVNELSRYATVKFDRLLYLTDIIRVKQRYISQKSSLNFFVTAGKKAYGYKEVLKNYISQKGFNVLDFKTNNSISIKISLSCTLYNNAYMDIAVVRVLIKVYENSLHVGGRNYTFKERYFGSTTKAYQAALQDFTKTLQTKTISKALDIAI